MGAKKQAQKTRVKIDLKKIINTIKKIS